MSMEYVALLRGINVGGKNRLAMKELKSICEDLGWSHVKSYIQSGNLVFNASARPEPSALSLAIKNAHAFAPEIIILSSEDFLEIFRSCPFPSMTGKDVHFFFLGEPARDFDEEKFAAIRVPSEEFLLSDACFYLHAPEGIARSKLAAKAEQLLGVPTTARNHRSVVNIAALCEES